MINDLKSRLKNHRKFAPPLEGIAFEYGFNTNQVDPWAKYWAEEYNFKERENYFNQFPHYKTNIQGLDIHFIRVKPHVPAGVTRVPLLLLHGWGGSIREFYDVIPLLTTPSEEHGFVFEVIVPSLPGFGFSDPAVRPGMGPAQMGVILRNLMNRLGHEKYYLQGGDWGAITANTIATMFPNEVLGYHTNMMIALNTWTEVKTLTGVIAAAQGAVSNNPIVPLIEETAFFFMQATKPDTIGLMLTESPVSFLAYMLEKFSVMTRYDKKTLADGGLYEDFTREQLIDNLMVYWSTNSITSSVRLYAEGFSNKYRGLKMDESSSPVPTWALYAKHEIFRQPLNNLKFPNIIGATVLDEGGHFVAFQLPQVFAADVFKAVKAFMGYHNNMKCEL
ncbi:juvenile hormone epoxide hydrolase-like [Maniola hyperantus]|uniref:juvenile hormone epoxide hydrolase-like n=1 Tax=Aphantopus hyperantus TaxID=2795564 RepID=UPI001568CF74|nr:juvenile hormone epoxide hydrolase-like [Maniola hyperantus]